MTENHAADLLFDAFGVFVGAGVHTDFLAHIDEEGHIDVGTGLHDSAFEGVGGGVALHARIRLDNLEFHERGKLAGERGVGVGVVHDLHVLALLEEVGIVDELLLDGELLVSLRVHEDIGVVAFLVEELVGTALHAGELNLDAGVEPELLDSPRLEVFQFGADEGVALAGFHVQEFDDGPEFVVVNNTEAVLKISSCCHTIILF